MNRITGMLVSACALLGMLSLLSPSAEAQGPAPSIVRKVDGPTDSLDLIVNTSRLLTLEKRIPKALVDNPEIAELHPRAANVVQIVAKKAGFTNLTLWDEDGKIHTISVLVTGDARELSTYLRRHFPKASLKVDTLANSVVISGSVDDPAHINQIVTMARDFFPNVINRISVGGVQQIVLHVKVMEVSRTKLRTLGFDFAHFATGGDFAASTVSGLITAFGTGVAPTTSSGSTFTFGLMGGNSSFFGVLEALRRNNVARILAEPNLVTVSGRPAFFNSGGEFPILVPQSLGTVSVEYKKFGTQVDFVPVVLSNGNIRLEVRPRISEIDISRGVNLGNITVPGLRVREVDTGVEMRAGQTLAIAGLVQSRMEAETKGLPWLMDLPGIGAAFRRVTNEENEIELLVLVTPELVHAMEPHQVPPCGPGMFTTNPNDHELYWKGYLEVPRCCPPCSPGTGHGGYGMPAGAVGAGVLPPGAIPQGGEQVIPGTPPGAMETPMDAPLPEMMDTSAQGNRQATPARRTADRPHDRRVPPQRQYRNAPPQNPGPSHAPRFIGRTGYDVDN